MNKIIKIGVIAVLLAGVGIMISLIMTRHKELEQKEEEKNILEMPDFSFEKADGGRFTPADLRKDRPVVFMRFHPGCEHCLEELEKISAAKEEMSIFDFVLITHASPEMAEQFFTGIHLADWENMRLVYDFEDNFEKSFHLEATPSLAVFDADRSFSGSFDGMVVDPQTLLYTLRGEVEVKIDGKTVGTAILGEEEDGKAH